MTEMCPPHPSNLEAGGRVRGWPAARSTPDGQGSQPGRGPRVPGAARLLRTRRPSLLGPSTPPQRSLRTPSPRFCRLPDSTGTAPLVWARPGGARSPKTLRQVCGAGMCVHHIPGCLSVPTSESCCRHTALPSPRGHPGSAPPKGTRGHRPAPRQASLPWCPRGLQGVPQEHWPAEQPPPPTLVCSFLLHAPLHGPTPTMSKDPALPAFPGALLSSGCPPGEAGTARAALGPRTTGTEWGPPPTMGAPRPGGRTHP